MNQEQKELRGMVVAFALEQARKLVEMVETSEIEHARTVEKFDVAGTEWSIAVAYWADDDDVIRIEGKPHHEPDEKQDWPEILERLFNTHQDTEGEFIYLLPRTWLPGA